jgi:hypothetical protein
VRREQIGYLDNLRRAADQEEEGVGLGVSWTHKEVPGSEFYIVRFEVATERRLLDAHIIIDHLSHSAGSWVSQPP